MFYTHVGLCTSSTYRQYMLSLHVAQRHGNLGAQSITLFSYFTRIALVKLKLNVMKQARFWSAQSCARDFDR